MANMVYWRSSRSLYRGLCLRSTGCRPLAPMMRKFHDDDSGVKDDFKKRMMARLIKKESPLTGNNNTKFVDATRKTNPKVDAATLSKLSVNNEINSLSNVVGSKKNSIDTKSAKSSSTEKKSSDSTIDKDCCSNDELDPNAMIVATRVKAFVSTAEVKELVCKPKKVADTKPTKSTSTTKSAAKPVGKGPLESLSATFTFNKTTPSDQTKPKATGSATTVDANKKSSQVPQSQSKKESSQVGAKPVSSKTTTNIHTVGDKLKDKVNKAIANNAKNSSQASKAQSKKDSSQHGAKAMKSKSTSDITNWGATPKDKVNKSDATINASKKSSEASKDKITFEKTASGDKTKDKVNSSAATDNTYKSSSQASKNPSKNDSSKDGAKPVKSESTSDTKSWGATPKDKVNKSDAAINANKKSSEASKGKITFETSAFGDKTKDEVNSSAATANTYKSSSQASKIQSKNDSSEDKTKDKLKSTASTVNPIKISPHTPKPQLKNDSSKDGFKPMKSKSTSDIKTLGDTSKDKVSKSNITVNANTTSSEALKDKNITDTSASGDKTKDKVKSSASINANEKSSQASKAQSQIDISRVDATPVNSKSISDIKIFSGKIKDKENKTDKSFNSNKKSSDASKTTSTSKTSGDKITNANEKSSQASKPDLISVSSQDGIKPSKSNITLKDNISDGTPEKSRTHSESSKNTARQLSDKSEKDWPEVPWSELFSELYKSRSMLSDAMKKKDFTTDKEKPKDHFETKPEQNNIDESNKNEKSNHAKPKSAQNKIDSTSQGKVSSKTEISRSESKTKADDDLSSNKTMAIGSKSETEKYRYQCKATRCQRKSIAKRNQSEAKASRSNIKSTAESERAAIAEEGMANPKRFSNENDENLSKAKPFQKQPDNKYTSSDSNKASKDKNNSTSAYTTDKTSKDNSNDIKADQKSSKVKDVQSQSASSSTKTKANDASQSITKITTSKIKASQNNDKNAPSDKPRKNLRVKGCIPNVKNQTKPNLYEKKCNATLNPKNTNPQGGSLESSWPEKSLYSSGKNDIDDTINSKSIDLVKEESSPVSLTQSKTDFSPDGIKIVSDFKSSYSDLNSRSHGIKVKCARPGQTKNKGSIASLVDTEPASHLEPKGNEPESQEKLGTKRKESSEDAKTISQIKQASTKGSMPRKSSEANDKTIGSIISDGGQSDVVADCHTSSSASSSSRKDRTIRSFRKSEFVGSDVSQIGSELVTKEYQTAADSVCIEVKTKDSHKGSQIAPGDLFGSNAGTHNRKVREITENESGLKGEKKENQTKVEAGPEVSAEPKRRVSLTQYLYEIITGRGNSNNESGRRSITTYSAVNGRNGSSDGWHENRSRGKISRRQSGRRLQKKEVFISPDLAKRGLGAETIRRERRNNSGNNTNADGNKGSYWSFDALDEEPVSELLVISSPVCIPDVLDANKKVTTTLNENLILGAGRAQTDQNVVNFADEDELTKIRGGNSLDCEDKSPLAQLQKKENADNSIEIMGGSETCSKKFEDLEDSKDGDESSKSSFSSLGRQLCKNLLLFIFRTDKKP